MGETKRAELIGGVRDSPRASTRPGQRQLSGVDGDRRLRSRLAEVGTALHSYHHYHLCFFTAVQPLTERRLETRLLSDSTGGLDQCFIFSPCRVRRSLLRSQRQDTPIREQGLRGRIMQIFLSRAEVPMMKDPETLSAADST